MTRWTGLNGRRRVLLGAGTLAAALLLAAVGQHAASQQAPPGKTVLGVACSQIPQLGIDKQANLRAAAIRVGCGLEAAGSPAAVSGEAAAPPALPGNVDTVTGVETSPHVTQSESMVWSSDGQTIVVNMNDSRTAPANYSGVSVSTDGGVSFTRLTPSPFATGHGTNFGDPNVVYNQKLAKWFAADLGTACGGQGLGLWTSLDALTWAAGVCAHSSASDDRNSMWVDNTPSSPFYGRMYMSWNDFALGGGALEVTHSDDGAIWFPVVVSNTGTFARNVQVTGGPDGSVLLASMDEGGGGLAGPRHNYMFRSLDGGVTWTATPGISMGASFTGPGDSVCASNAYFAKITPIWRHMGWGQPGVGPNKVVHYAYAGKGVNAGDTGDIYYVRSTDNGLTWSTPIVLNTDQAAGGTKAQWMPSLSVTAGGDVHVYWYDRRDTTDGVNYKVYGRQSRNNGLTWLNDEPVSTVLIPQPAQPDPNVQACYAGDYNYATALGNRHYATWADGRVIVAAVNQQDVFFASVAAKPPLCCGDFNGDKKADVLFRNNDGTLDEWQLNGTTVLVNSVIGVATTDWAVVGLGDFNGDGFTDILWRNGVTGQLYIWFMNGTTILPSTGSPGSAPNGWQIAGVGDFDGDGFADILWRNANGDVAIWYMNGLAATPVPVASTSLDWQIAGVGDFNGDGKADVLWRNNNGTVWEWPMILPRGTIGPQGSPGSAGNDWQIAGVGDFNGDGKSDILWRNNTSGQVYEWLLNGLGIIGGGVVGTVTSDWQIAGVGDFNGDLKSDILWRHTSGVVYEWLLNGITIVGGGVPSPGSAGNDWQIE